MSLVSDFAKELARTLDEDSDILTETYLEGFENGGIQGGAKKIFEYMWPADLWPIHRDDYSEPSEVLAYVALKSIKKDELRALLLADAKRLAVKAEGSKTTREWREDMANSAD